MINDFITEVSGILQIPVPEISFDTSTFSTETTLAQCEIDVNDPDGCIIHLKKCDKPDPEQFFIIAHELRHVWQFQQGLYLKSATNVNQSKNITYSWQRLTQMRSEA